MIVRRLAALKPWTTPLALSVAVHGAIVGAALGLGGLVEPPRPEAVMPVELVFAVAPAAVPATAVSVPSEAPAAASSPVSTPTVKQVPATLVALPPLPKRKPMPPDVPILASAPAQPAPPPLTGAEVRAANAAIARMLDDAAAKGRANSQNEKTVFSPPPRPSPIKGEGEAVAPPEFPPPSWGRDRVGGETVARPANARQASRFAPAATLVPPGWGVAGLANTPPAYPLAARRSGAEGRVVLRVWVSAGGAVEAVTVAVSSGHELLDEAARRGVAGWRFVPGRLAGVPVAASVDVPVVFRLRD